MTNFYYAVGHTLEAEGVFSNHEADPGGKTKYGVTERMWGAYWEDQGYELPVKKIEALSVIDATEFYKHVFWEALQLDRIPDKHIAAEIFDSAVNMGAGDAVRFLQGAINYLRLPDWEPIKVDGIIGPVTRGRIRALIAGGYRVPLLIAMNGEQYIHYKEQDNQYMSRGWTKRLQLASELA